MDEKQLFTYAKSNQAKFDSFCERVTEFIATNEYFRREDGSIIELCRTPYLVDPKVNRTVQKVSTTLYGILDKALKYLCSEQKYQEFFPEHSVFDKELLVKKSYSSSLFLLRFDFILEGDKPKLLEFNTSCPAGMCFLSGWRKLLSQGYDDLHQLKLLGDFALDDPHFFCKQIISVANFNYGIEKPSVCIVNDNANLSLELPLIQKIMHEMGYPCVIRNLNQLRFNAGKLTDEIGTEINVVYCKLRPTPSVLWGWTEKDFRDYAGFLEAYRTDCVCILNPFQSLTIGEDKGMVALLRSGVLKDLFSDEERDVITNYIPRTYFLDESTLESKKEITNYHGNFLIKPRMESRGRLITFGRDYNQAEWSDLLRQRCDGQWVIQEFVNPVPKLSAVIDNGELSWREMKHTFSVFMINGQCSGMYARTAFGDIHNVGSGGHMQVVATISGDGV